LSISDLAREPRFRAWMVWSLLGLTLAGCGGGNDQHFFEVLSSQSAGLPVAGRGQPVPPEVAQVLASASAGAPLEYRLASGNPVGFLLGPIYHSGAGTNCRVGRIRSGEGANGSPTAYAFCNLGNQWYEMNPVVVSGY
jgi:hypothetical protein